MQITEIRIEASQSLDLISIQMSYSEIALTLKRLLLWLSNCRKLLILGCSFTWCKLLILFMFVYDKNKDTPFCIGSIDQLRTKRTCPLTGSVWLLKVSTYGRCLVIEAVHFWILKVSTYGRCRVIEGVHLREVSGYWRCKLAGGVRWWLKVFTARWCLVIEGVHFQEVSGY